jgi:hypothetical protein
MRFCATRAGIQAVEAACGGQKDEPAEIGLLLIVTMQDGESVKALALVVAYPLVPFTSAGMF